MCNRSLYKNIWCSWQMSWRETKQNLRGCRGWSVLSMYQIFGAFVSLIGKKEEKMSWTCSECGTGSAVHVLLYRFYPNFILILSKINPDFIKILSRFFETRLFYQDFIQIFWNSLYPDDFILIFEKNLDKRTWTGLEVWNTCVIST